MFTHHFESNFHLQWNPTMSIFSPTCFQKIMILGLHYAPTQLLTLPEAVPLLWEGFDAAVGPWAY